MRRGVFDTLRRGFDNAVANWGLIVVRIAEMFLFGLIAVIAAFAIVVPILVSIGIQFANITTPDDLVEAMFTLMQQWMLLVWALVAVGVLLIVFVALHSFVDAGCARVYVDGERMAGPAVEGPRTRFRAFSMERWWAGGRDGWWQVFWIYNFAWGLAGLILLIPLIPTLLFMLVFRESPPMVITTGCIGLLLTGMLMILVAIVTGMWTNRAIADWAVHRTGAATTLSEAWRALKADLGRHVLIALAIFVVAMAGSSFFSSFSLISRFASSVHDTLTFSLLTLPLSLAGSILSSMFSAAIAAWYLASYAALSVEKKS